MTFYCPIGQELLNFVTNCCKLLKVNHCLPGARTGSFFYCMVRCNLFQNLLKQSIMTHRIFEEDFDFSEY